MNIIRSLRGIFLIAAMLTMVVVPLAAQNGHDNGTASTATNAGDVEAGATEHGTADAAGVMAEESAEGVDQGEGEHADGHVTEGLLPNEEMMRVLEHKVENSKYIHEYPFPEVDLPQNWKVTIAGFTLDFSPSRHIVYMWFGALLTILLTWLAARQNRTGFVPRGYGNMIESMVVFIRDEVANPFLGHNAAKYMPLLLSFFFFITIMNLVGLMPFGAASTGNINITGGLALVTLSFMIFGGMKSNGVLGYWRGLVPSGIPFVIGILMFFIELLGLLMKPFALAIRLFANMLSGALVIGAFYALIFGMDTVLVAPLSIVFLLFMSLLKIFICLLQAYIFTMLSSFFIGMSLHQEH